MTRIVSLLVFITFFFFFFSFEVDAQVVQKKSNKVQLNNGVKVHTNTPNKLIRLKPNSIKSSGTSKGVSKAVKPQEKLNKPPKVLKYGNRRILNNGKKEDE